MSGDAARRAPSAWRGATRLILASRSKTRAALLSSYGIEPELMPADVAERTIEAEEAARGALPAAVARRLAAAKAQAVSVRSPGRLVLGADQVLAFEDRCWAKAADLAEAAARLGRLSGQSHRLISACALARDGALVYEAVETAELAMRALSKTDIETYLGLAGEGVLTSVGAYQIEGVGRLLFERVEADHAVILGLPVSGLLSHLRRQGLLAF